MPPTDLQQCHPKVQEYIDGVQSGAILACRYVRQAVDRHVRDLADGHKRGLVFDPAAGWFAIEFLECLKLSHGRWGGQPLVLSPWQCFVTWCLFGWKRKADGFRRFRTAYLELARKNGKSTMTAGYGHKLFLADGEEGAEVYTAATKLKQAKIVHEEAKRMTRKSPLLKARVTILRDNLYDQKTESKYEPLASDGETLDGLNVHGAIVDEVHAHKTRMLWDVLESATGARDQPLLIAITTAGDGNDRTTICYELRSYTQKVLEGIIDDDTWFGVIYCLDEAQYDAEGQEVAPPDDWTDERVWIKANPNLGISVNLDDLQRKCKKAKETPAAQVEFRRKHTNQWVSASSDWLPAGLWDANRGGPWYGPAGLLPEVRERFRGRTCFASGDLSSVSDLTAVVLAFPCDDGLIEVLPFAWCPRENAIGRQRDRRVPYVTWSQLGQLVLTEGNSVDYDFIRAQLVTLRDDLDLDIRDVALDPHNARYLVTKLAETDGFTVFEHRQGYLSMNSPIKETQRLLLDKKIRHGGHQPLAWCVSNVVTTHDAAGNVKFDKHKSSEKIDLAVALVMAVGRASVQPENQEPQLIVC